MHRTAFIDLGTNSIRFDIHQFGPQKKFETLYREKFMVRLGEDVFTTGHIQPEALERTIKAIQGFKKTAKFFKAHRFVAFGTSALREAANQKFVLQKIKIRTGIQIRVLSGHEEANLIAHGILQNERRLRNRFIIVDIGGGSTELILCEKQKIIKAVSLPLGVARIQQIFLKTIPPKIKDKKSNPIQILRHFIQQQILPFTKHPKWKQAQHFIGSSGTARALSKALSKEKIDSPSLQKFVKKITPLNLEKIIAIPQIEDKRADLILAGSILVEELMKGFSIRFMTPTEFSLRDGLIFDEAQMNIKKTETQIEFHMSEIEYHAKKLNTHRTHFVQVTENCNVLFEKLKKIHKLKPEWKPYLQAAALFHDSGETINPVKHPEHSYYIVKNLDLPFLKDWEKDFIARLCLEHQNSKTPKWEYLDKKIDTAFLKLLALLRVADALDRSHRSPFKIKQVKVLKNQITLIPEKKSDGIELEILRLEHKKKLFERCFKKKILLKTT